MTIADTVDTILKALNETDEIPRRQVTMIVEILGEEAAQELRRETEEIESQGGMMSKDGLRRRTPGGVFFTLARGKLSRDDRNKIFRIRPPQAGASGASGRASAAEGHRPVGGRGAASRRGAGSADAGWSDAP